MSIQDPEYLDVSPWEDDHDKFALRVQGDSMLADHIADGDYVIIDKRATPAKDSIIAIRDDDGDAILGRFLEKCSIDYLYSHVRIGFHDRPKRPRSFERNKVLGVLVGVVRKC